MWQLGIYVYVYIKYTVKGFAKEKPFNMSLYRLLPFYFRRKKILENYGNILRKLMKIKVLNIKQKN